MSKTAREVAVEFLKDWEIEEVSTDYTINRMFETLEAAGFVIVPKEPTEEMLITGRQAAMAADEDWNVNASYRAMIATAAMSKPKAG